MPESETVWITTQEAVEIMGVAVRTVQNLCRKDNPNFDCRKWGNTWMVSRASALRYIKNVGGRPKVNDE